MKGITFRDETRGGSAFIVAEGPSSHDIARELHQRLVAGVNGKIDMEFARQLVRLGWTPPPGHPVLNETAEGNRPRSTGGEMTDEEIEVLISRLLDEMHTGPDVIEIQTIVKALTLMVAVRNVI